MPFNLKHYFFTLSITYTLVLLFANAPAIKTEPKPATPYSMLFYITSLLSQMFLYAIILTAFTLFITSIIPNIHVAIFINAIILTIGWMLVLANSKVYARYRFNINPTIINLVFHKGASEVVQPTMKEGVFFITTLLIMLVLAGSLEYFSWTESQLTTYSTITTHILLAIFYVYLLNQFSYIILRYYGHMPTLQYTCKIFGYHITSWSNLLSKLNLQSNNITNRLIKSTSSSDHNKPLNYPQHPIQFTPPAKPLNIMMIAIDACRFDMITPNIMPHITNFSQQAHIFNDHWSHGNTTQPGIFNLFYSIPPNYWHAITKQHITPVFIDQLRRMEYHTAIFTSANLINPPFDKNIFYNIKNLRTFTPGKNSLQRDQQITQDMNQFLIDHNTNRPFFGFLFYDAAHGYYTLGDKLPQQFTPTDEMNHITVKATTDPAPIFNQYKNALYAIDKMIDTVLTTLKTTGLLDSTVVIITSDHGQEFNDLKKNHWEHPSNFAKYQLQVPMIIHWPGQHPQQHQHRTSHSDIVPTLMQRALGVRNPLSDYSIGKDLFDPIDTPFILAANYTNYAIVNFEQIITLQRDGHFQVYDHGLNHIHAPTLNIKQMLKATQLMHSFDSHSF